MYVEDIWFESWPVHHPSELKFLLLLVKQQLQNEPDDHLHIVKNTLNAWSCTSVPLIHFHRILNLHVA
jgi:hypothetical protein